MDFVALILLILILSVLIFLHELGHFITAKKSGAYVYEFAIGMGPKLFSFKRKNKNDPTEYSLSCENMGFSVSDTFDEENGHLWTCTRSNIGINETVTILSKDMESTESVRITVQLESDKKPEASLMVFKRMTTIPYEGNSDENCQRMQQWIEDNLNNDKASEIFDGGVQLTIYAPSDFVRMMDISKAQ